MSLVSALFLSLLGTLVSALLFERAKEFSAWLITFATQSMPPEIRESHREQWLADNSEIRGAAWTILNAVGCVWLCRNWICSSFVARFRTTQLRHPDQNAPTKRIEKEYDPTPNELKPILSLREREILNQMAAGKTNWEISIILEISEAAVRQYSKQIACKLECVNRTHMVAVAIQRGLISP